MRKAGKGTPTGKGKGKAATKRKAKPAPPPTDRDDLPSYQLPALNLDEDEARTLLRDGQITINRATLSPDANEIRWVREPWRRIERPAVIPPGRKGPRPKTPPRPDVRILYRADTPVGDGVGERWNPASSMPREFSRMSIRIVGIERQGSRVECWIRLVSVVDVRPAVSLSDL